MAIASASRSARSWRRLAIRTGATWAARSGLCRSGSNRAQPHDPWTNGRGELHRRSARVGAPLRRGERRSVLGYGAVASHGPLGTRFRIAPRKDRYLAATTALFAIFVRTNRLVETRAGVTSFRALREWPTRSRRKRGIG